MEDLLASWDRESWEDFNISEETLVQAIKQHLQTPEQRDLLAKSVLSIEDLLNGRYTEKEEGVVRKVYSEWNGKLGWVEFGGGFFWHWGPWPPEEI